MEVTDLSDAQLAANRANAGHSTGPRTEEGKQRSCLNAMKHGLTGRTVVLPKENQEEYRAYSKRMVDSLKPGTPEEEELAHLIADQYWRLRRVRAIEEAVLDGEDDRPGGLSYLATLGVYVQRISRVLKDAGERLREMQAQRKKEEEDEKDWAIRLYKFHKMCESPWHPQEFGFVYSAKELEKAIHLRDMKCGALFAGKFDYDAKKFEAWREEKDRLAAMGEEGSISSTRGKTQ